MRLFVSVDLPPELTEPLADLQAEFGDAAGVRLTDPSQAHVTLKFLGETDPGRVDEIEQTIQRAVDDSAVEPFECIIYGLGVFPALDYISVVWAGLGEDGGAAALTHLHDAIETELTALGFDAESHGFTPHVTLGRMDDARGKSLVQHAVRETDETVGSFQVERIRLTESTLTDEGPVYETVSEVDL